MEIDVPSEAIDEMRHVNNREYLTWMQDVAAGHSTAAGWPMPRYFELGAAWVVRSHYVEYLRPAFEGDSLHVHTWVADMHEWRSTRGYLFWRERDRAVVARAETLWVFVDVERGRPRRIPAELRGDFTPVAGGEEEVRERLGLTERG